MQTTHYKYRSIISVFLLFSPAIAYCDVKLDEVSSVIPAHQVFSDEKGSVFAYRAGDKLFYFLRGEGKSNTECVLDLTPVMIDLASCSAYKTTESASYRLSRCFENGEFVSEENYYDAKAFYYLFDYSPDDFNHVKSQFVKINKEEEYIERCKVK